MTTVGAGISRNSGWIPGKTRGVSLLQFVQIDCGTHPLSYWMGTRGAYSGNIAAGAWSWLLIFI